MSHTIKPHHQDEDILRLNLFTDIGKWKSEVKFIAMENKFYKKLFSSSLAKKTELNQENLQQLQKELKSLNERNNYFTDKVQEFHNELEGIRECDDLQCETFFLNNHQELKVTIENYFFQNRDLKSRIYSFLEDTLKKVNKK